MSRVNRIACTGFAVGVVVLSIAACGTEPGEESVGAPKVTTTFSVGDGPLPDVASDPSTHHAFVTSSGDDSLYVVDAESRTATIKVGKAPVGVAVEPTTQTAYVTGDNSVSIVDIASGSITGIGRGRPRSPVD